MLGAIIGDIVGSVYEWNNIKTKDFLLFRDDRFFPEGFMRRVVADRLGIEPEAMPGGHIALNFRTWVAQDAVLWPAGKIVRASWRLPRLGPVIAQRRLPARLGWQANRLTPKEVLSIIGPQLTDVRIFRGPKRRPFGLPHTKDCTFEGVHRSHWWIVAQVK